MSKKCIFSTFFSSLLSKKNCLRKKTNEKNMYVHFFTIKITFTKSFHWQKCYPIDFRNTWGNFFLIRSTFLEKIHFLDFCCVYLTKFRHFDKKFRPLLEYLTQVGGHFLFVFLETCCEIECLRLLLTKFLGF